MTHLIRNFSIIAHIDHGKSTLADRVLEICHAVDKRRIKEQMLDSMDLERERGITIKMQPVALTYPYEGLEYKLNLIDTPGHVDFTYEVSRSLAACEGALLVIDAGQGIEAQTLANYYLALERNLDIVPVINKIDLPSADIEKVSDQVEEVLGIERERIIPVSAKTGQNIDLLLAAVIKHIQPPKADKDGLLRALVFDSSYDNYKGASATVRVFSGCIKAGDQIKFYTSNEVFTVDEVGQYKIDMEKLSELRAGAVGYILASLKDVSTVKLGDTITLASRPCPEPVIGYKEIKPMVFAGVFPVNSDDYGDFKEALEKLKLNDSSLQYQQENSEALGFGFRCGFLGLLHLEIIQERIEREYDIQIITTAPSVEYRVFPEGQEMMVINNPSQFPEGVKISKIEEPYIEGYIVVNEEYIGNIMALLQEKRGFYKNLVYIKGGRVEINVELPLNEIVFDFHDKLKSCSKGYASFNYEFSGYKDGDLVKMDILIDEKRVDALSIITHRDEAPFLGREIVRKLQKLIPRHLFKIPLQAAVGNKIIVRENIAALRKDVTAKCYGGDISRKRKLLQKQKEGKKRMKAIGNVEIPQEAFLAVLSVDDK